MKWLTALLLLLAVPAWADDLRPGYLELTQTSGTQWQMVWRAPIIGGLAARATPVVPGGCSPSLTSKDRANGALTTRWVLSCPAGLIGKQVGLTGLDTLQTDALVRIAPLGKPVQAARLTPAAPITRVAAEVPKTNVAATYFGLGVTHILTGYDHLLFVLALVLLLSGGWRIAKAVTAFTAAHSLTLIATTLGLISLPRAPVESCIALSIMFLAVEIVKRDATTLRLSERIPWIVAFLFGLLHGFGFAGALAEIGLPKGEVPMALLTFNLGVEAGQLIIVGAGMAVLALIRRISLPALRPAQIAAAYAIGATASFWFITRTFA
jgi:hydrogenase/urease accessory protein HupE